MTRVHCKLCEGTGKRPLTPTERATLDTVADEWESTGAIAARQVKGVYRTMLCNRLVVLESIGVIESRRDPSVPREKLWRRAEALRHEP